MATLAQAAHIFQPVLLVKTEIHILSRLFIIHYMQELCESVPQTIVSFILWAILTLLTPLLQYI